MKNYKYIKYFSKPFLEDLVNGKTLPIVGAGFSKNADIPSNKKMLGWNELGMKFAEEIEDYKFTNPIDAISAYSHEFTRTKMVEKLTSLLLINTVKPGNTHKAFCALPFDIVCTTNFEFLIEDGYKLVNKYCRPIIDEDQLSISGASENIILLKLHGDLHHPKRLVATEEDYDSFLNKYPMLATYVANLLISRTPFFIGYSLDDSDFRQIWQLIKERLGSLRRQAYVIKINCSSHEKARFERRGVKVINIKGNPSDYPIIFKEVFEELKDYWNKTLIENQIITEDNAMAELSLPDDSNNRLCFFSIPVKLLPFYKKYIFPVVKRQGLIPISADDVIIMGENWMAKITALIKKSEFIVVDIGTQNTLFELGLALSNKERNTRVLIIKDEFSPIPVDISNYLFITRPENPYDNFEEITFRMEQWFMEMLEPLKQTYLDEPERLLKKKEYRASVISAISLFENHLRERLLDFTDSRGSRSKSLYSLLELAQELQIIPIDMTGQIKEWMHIRNSAVHSKQEVGFRDAKRIVNGIYNIMKGKNTNVNNL